MKTIELNGQWEFRMRGGEWAPATVPGCNYTDLLALGKIPDPFIGLNEEKTLWVGESDWIYRKTFEADGELLSCDRVALVAEALDTLAIVKLNGSEIARTQNAHIGYSFEVKDYLKQGENLLEIEFLSPVAYIIEKNNSYPMPPNSNGIDGAMYIRKPQCHFGWDWGPTLPISGITRDIRVEGKKSASLLSMRIGQTHSNGAVSVEVILKSEQYSPEEKFYRLSLVSPDGATEEKIIPYADFAEATFAVEKPELWWTSDLSDRHPLYTVKAEILLSDEVVSRKTKRIGLRTLFLDRSEDGIGNRFRFVLNGVPLFAKGADYIPSDSFITRFGKVERDALFDAANYAHFNMLRVWGGGYYESDEFYDSCDENGILVWQDFAFACMGYPFFDEEYIENSKREIAYNVERLDHRASLALWCGNNEIEQVSLSYIWRKNIINGHFEFFYNIAPAVLKEEKSQVSYIPGSPCGDSYMKNLFSDDTGDTHLWGVWHRLKPLTYYRKRKTRFCSEFGLESIPEMRTVNTFADGGELALNSDVFLAHQKNKSGNNKMLFYTSTRFSVPDNFPDMAYTTQMIQSEGVKDATEHWRRNRAICGGALYWQFNDCWPVNSWSSYDYYGRYKSLQYVAREVNAPQTISVYTEKNKIYVYLLNDKNSPLSGTIKWKLESFEGKTLAVGKAEASANACSASEALVLNLTNALLREKMRCVFAAEFVSEGVGSVTKTLLFRPEYKLNLPPTEIETEIKTSGRDVELTLKSAKYARFVKIALDIDSSPLSENFFDMLAGTEKKVTFTLKEELTPAEIEKHISLRSIGDLKSRTAKIVERIFRLSVRFLPVKFTNKLSKKLS